MRYTINVTREHIDKGERGCPFGCPVALAIQEQTFLHANVVGNVVFLRASVGHPDFPSGARRVVSLPEIARKFVSDFDFALNPMPLSFELDMDAIPPYGWDWM